MSAERTTRHRSTLIRSALVCGWIVPAVLPPVRAEDLALHITVRIFDDANVRPSILRGAENVATRIFGKAGIRIEWCQPAATVDEKSIVRQQKAGATLDLRMLRDFRDIQGLGPDVMAFAERNTITVDVNRVVKSSHYATPSVAQLLGGIIAHEMGHVLMRGQSHGKEGIMRAHWDRYDLESDGWARLAFTTDEVQRIQSGLMAQETRNVLARSAITALQLKVQLYNGARVSSRELLRAEDRAARVFKRANIIVSWTAVPVPKSPSPDVAYEQWAPGDLQLRIWTRSLAQPSLVDSDALGFCTSIEAGQAVVLFDAVRSLVRSRSSNAADVLGLAIAHEMGHILLRSVNHSNAGIMRSRWLPDDLRKAERGLLVFTREQVDSMQTEVLRRMGQYRVPLAAPWQ